MKKVLAICAMAAVIGLIGCHHVHCAEQGRQGPLKVVATTFPVWLFSANVIGNAPGVELELLIPGAAGCPHDFALKPADLRKLASARALVINGAGLEEFLAKPLANLENRPDIIDASLNVPVLDSSHASHSHVNSHVFAAPGEAALMVENIAAGLAALDPANASLYADNGAAYMEKLANLSKRLEAVGQRAANKGIVLEHEGLAYLAANAGLTIVAMIDVPVSPASLTSLERTIAAEKPVVLAGEVQYSAKLLDTLSAQTGVPAIRLDTCASGPENAPLDYYQTEMEKNIEMLEQHFD